MDEPLPPPPRPHGASNKNQEPEVNKQHQTNQAIELRMVGPEGSKAEVWLRVLDSLKQGKQASLVVKAVQSLYGLDGLSALLVVASAKHMDEVVDNIVDLTYKVLEPELFASKDNANRLKVYSELVSLPGFPPVGLEWVNMPHFCDLCEMMPGILTSKTGLRFFDKLFFPIEQLYLLPGCVLSLTEHDDDQGKYDVDAMCNTDRFVVLKSEHAKSVVRVLPGQQVKRTDVYAPLKHDALASTNHPFDENRTETSPEFPALQASPDNKFLLWVHNIADPHKAPFTVLDVTTGTHIEVCDYFANAYSVWWAGTNTLGVRARGCMAWQSFGLSELASPPSRLVNTIQGTTGAINAKYAVSIQAFVNINDLTIATRAANPDMQVVISRHQIKASRVVGDPHSDNLFYIFDKNMEFCYELDVEKRGADATGVKQIDKSVFKASLAKLVWTAPNMKDEDDKEDSQYGEEEEEDDKKKDDKEQDAKEQDDD